MKGSQNLEGVRSYLVYFLAADTHEALLPDWTTSFAYSQIVFNLLFLLDILMAVTVTMTLTAITFVLVVINQSLKVFFILLNDDVCFVKLKLWIKTLFTFNLGPILVDNDIVFITLSIP